VKPDLTLLLRYGTYYIFNLWRLPRLEAPTTPEEILEVSWHNFQTMRDEQKNADLKCYFKMKKTGNLKRTWNSEKPTLSTQKVF
jgi:hypothetical protein